MTSVARKLPRAGLMFPVLMKEMRSRMRGKRVPLLLLLTTVLAALAGCAVLFFMSLQNGYNSSGFDQSASAQMGRMLFNVLMFLEGFICAVITPALCGGVIALEQEKQTLDFLLLTRLSSWNIVLGKYLSALSMVALVFLCSLPVIANSFILGGVDPQLFLLSVIGILSTVLLLGAVSLCCSAYLHKSATSLAVAYSACLAWMMFSYIFSVYLMIERVVPGFSGISRFTGYLIACSLLIRLLFTWGFLALAVRGLNRRRTDRRGEKRKRVTPKLQSAN